MANVEYETGEWSFDVDARYSVKGTPSVSVDGVALETGWTLVNGACWLINDGNRDHLDYVETLNRKIDEAQGLAMEAGIEAYKSNR